MGDFGQNAEIKGLIHVLIDVLEYPVHPLLVLGEAVLPSHTAPTRMERTCCRRFVLLLTGWRAS